jgi:4-hydroxy-3-methylbut-2-enyl diphosphate reductase
MALARDLKVIDATCPLVTKVHLEAIKYARAGFTILLIGHADHDEVIGTLGEAPSAMKVVGTAEEVDKIEVPDPTKVAYLTQTTLSLDDTRGIIARLRRRFPLIQGPASEDICYATQNRQGAVLDLARHADMILVVGSSNSSNSRRLVEVSRSAGIPAHLIDDIEDIQPSWLDGIGIVGLTAGASAPEDLVERVVSYLRSLGFPIVETLGSIVEHVEFALPPELAREVHRPGV